MFNRFRRWWYSGRDEDGNMSEPKPLLSDEEVTEWFREHNNCPDCQGTMFLAGPSGGLSQNVLCETCHSEYNMSPVFIERISLPKKGRLHIYGLAPSPPGE